MTKPYQFVHVSCEDINKALSTTPLVGKRMVFPFDNFDERPFGIVEDHELNTGMPEIHTHEDDLWIGMEGETIFTLDGKLVDPSFGKLENGAEDYREIKGQSMVGGKKIVVRAGDVLWIPAGMSHMHTASGTARLLIYKNPKRS